MQSTWKKFVKIERFLVEVVFFFPTVIQMFTVLSRKQLKSRSLRQQNCDYLPSTCPSRKNAQQNLSLFSNSKVCTGVTNQSLALLPSYFILSYLIALFYLVCQTPPGSLCFQKVYGSKGFEEEMLFG